jgi:hypothetical protein
MRRTRQPKSRSDSREVLGTPAVPEDQSDAEQPWVLAYWHRGRTPDEPVEVLTDVKFFEQGVQQPARQGQAICTFGHRANIVETTVLSPGMDVRDMNHPSRWPLSRASSACGSVAHGRHLRQSAWL